MSPPRSRQDAATEAGSKPVPAGDLRAQPRHVVVPAGQPGPHISRIKRINRAGNKAGAFCPGQFDACNLFTRFTARIRKNKKMLPPALLYLGYS